MIVSSRVMTLGERRRGGFCSGGLDRFPFGSQRYRIPLAACIFMLSLLWIASGASWDSLSALERLPFYPHIMLPWRRFPSIKWSFLDMTRGACLSWPSEIKLVVLVGQHSRDSSNVCGQLVLGHVALRFGQFLSLLRVVVRPCCPCGVV